MKKFKYRLQALLKVKEHLEKERQKDLALSTHKVKGQENSLEELDTNRTSTLQSQTKHMVEKLSVADMLIYGRYLLKLKRDNLAGNEMLKVLKKDEDQKRQELLLATQARRVYEKLKEKQRALFYSEASTTERKDNDEIAVSNFRRRGH